MPYLQSVNHVLLMGEDGRTRLRQRGGAADAKERRSVGSVEQRSVRRASGATRLGI